MFKRKICSDFSHKKIKCNTKFKNIIEIMYKKIRGTNLKKKSKTCLTDYWENTFLKFI